MFRCAALKYAWRGWLFIAGPRAPPQWRTRDYVHGQCCACASSIILLQLQLQTRVRVSVVARLAVNKLRTLVDGDELMTQSREEGPKIRHHHVLLPPRSCQSLVLSFAALPLLLSPRASRQGLCFLQTSIFTYHVKSLVSCMEH